MMHKVIVKNQEEADPQGIADFEYFFGNIPLSDVVFDWDDLRYAKKMAERFNKEAQEIEWEWAKHIYAVEEI